MGARLSGAEYVPAYPITPQTEIIETLSRWFTDGTMRGEVRHDGLRALHGDGGRGCGRGRRAGLHGDIEPGAFYAMEVLFTVFGWRVPFVLVNVSRGWPRRSRSNPTTTTSWRRGTRGFSRSTARRQEIVDSILMAY